MRLPDDPRLDFTILNSVFDQILPDGSLLVAGDKMGSHHGKLFIGGISWDTDEERLKEYFSKYGEVVEAKKAVPRDDQNIINRNMRGITGSPVPGSMKRFWPRGFGFITYDSVEYVYRVLHKTFHELKRKLVEVKRAVPEELSPSSTRNPVIGYNSGLSRAANLLNSHAKGYNLIPLAEFGVKMDGRFNPLPTGRSGFPPLSTTSYGLGMDMEQGMSPDYGGNSNFGNSLGYGQIISPYYGGISNRFNTPIGYGVGSGRNDSNSSSATRYIWGNGGLSNATNASSPGSFLGTGTGSFGPLGNSGANWTAPPVQSGSNASGYTGGTAGYGSDDDNYGLGAVGYGRNGGTGAAPTPSFAVPTGSSQLPILMVRARSVTDLAMHPQMLLQDPPRIMLEVTVSQVDSPMEKQAKDLRIRNNCWFTMSACKEIMTLMRVTDLKYTHPEQGGFLKIAGYIYSSVRGIFSMAFRQRFIKP
ncbi:Tornado 1 [Hibiscus syriacus]|uniref:Tornado 1 n=1 Tax=Hibiscus syriacus TaxID=106335 RepID=A0A6A3CCK8_HIBSY|nr:Tornado 1 [Hibiscus syriacus]